MRLKRTDSLLISILVLALLLSTGCERGNEPVKIGLAINLSGRGGAAGEHIRDGALLAVDEINAGGGIHGRPLVLLVRDDRNTTAGVREAARTLLAEKAVAIIGHSTSANTLKAYPLVTAGQALLITAFTATTELSGRDDLFLRTSVDCRLYGRKMATLLQRKKVRSAVLLMDLSNRPFMEDYAEALEASFAGSLKQVVFDSRQDPVWPEILTELLEPAPEAVILLTEANMTGLAVQKIQERGFQGHRLATLWTQTPELLRIGGSAANGLAIVTFIDPGNSRPDYLAFDRQMREQFKKPATARAARGHEMVYILADAMRRCRKIEADDLKEALLAGVYQGIMGPVSFDRFGDVIRPVYEVVVADGVFRNLGEIE